MQIIKRNGVSDGDCGGDDDGDGDDDDDDNGNVDGDGDNDGDSDGDGDSNGITRGMVQTAQSLPIKHVREYVYFTPPRILRTFGGCHVLWAPDMSWNAWGLSRDMPSKAPETGGTSKAYHEYAFQKIMKLRKRVELLKPVMTLSLTKEPPQAHDDEPDDLEPAFATPTGLSPISVCSCAIPGALSNSQVPRRHEGRKPWARSRTGVDVFCYRSEGSLIQRLPMQSNEDDVDGTAPIQRLPMQSKGDYVDSTAPIQRLPMQSKEDDVDGTAPIQRLPFVVNYQLNVTITTGSSIASMRQCSLLPSVYLEIYQATMGGPGADGELQSTSEDLGPKAKPPSY
ncbi:hypothetical protein MBM_04195 [Drepanopeziza brunnea f. sp. 'multigermtubi' MB_m1]|uniref:Uncharacterized protein n=1 Tax=Marssonina brunnea f. sp. multigermtubi (strain MB_m1) TaxID=1072389 RepID=K1WXQ6_MARBU|nr:uncharacterized protein MBM_04195 [Drepanopeziza brunnea f. sp. 'multigermtubi' MB_m1]EKD17826.1 hypothetical protein MBM_04195 [Drepanopeziza brunnea f. sp. 'multigermtubi' MB_m1]